MEKGLWAVRIIAACALTLTLAGCAGQQPDPQAQAQAQAANDDARCQAYGAVPGSQDYIQCRKNFDDALRCERPNVGKRSVERVEYRAK